MLGRGQRGKRRLQGRGHLAGAGVARYRAAIAWGTVTTLAGSLASLAVAARLTTLFTTGIVTHPPTPAFGLAVLGGAVAWVGVATTRRLPVSTTHAIVGALIGAGVVLGPEAVAWAALLPRLVTPLLASVGGSYLLSGLINRLPPRLPECLCVDVAPAWRVEIEAQGAAAAVALPGSLPIVQVRTGTEAECRLHRDGAGLLRLTATGTHWLSSGAVGFARGLNDTPKIVALGTFALVPAGLTAGQVALVAALAMAAGSLLMGALVARVLAEEVVPMDQVEGLKANLATALLVGVGANLGLPMSTTHVATGAISGIAGVRASRLNRRTLRNLALAWTVTPLVAGLIAAGVFALFR